MTAHNANVLLVVSDSQNTAKRIESHLRNAGHPVRAAWVTDLEDVEDAIRRASPDLVLCAEHLEFAPHERVIELCTQIAPDLPVVLMSGDVGLDEASRALKAGARGVVCGTSDEYLPHLEMVCLREIANHNHLRELRQTRMQLAQFEARHRQLLAGSADAVAHIQEGVIAHCNPAFAERLGYDSAEAPDGLLFMDLIGPESVAEAKHLFRRFQQRKLDRAEATLQLRRADDTLITTEVRFSREGDEHDIQMLIRAAAGAAEESDAPGAPRAALATALARLNQAGNDGARALMLLHIDNFADCEARLGFVEAEQLVQTLGELVRSRLTADDRVYAFGNGEIALLLRLDKAKNVEDLAEALRKEVAAQIFKTESFETPITVSIAAYPLGGASPPPAEVIGDTATEARKLSEAGGNRVAALGEAAEAARAQRESKRLADEVRRAIERNRLGLAYQSIASLDGSSQQIFDVFVRMTTEGGAELLARDFLPAAEKAGLMRLIDRWVVGRVLHRLAKQEVPITQQPVFFVRLSEDTLRDADGFLRWALELIRKLPGANEHIVFQLRESILEKHVQRGRSLAHALAEAGVGVAIDYFGASPTCEAMLDHIPATYVKFHPQFTEHFHEPKTGKRFRELMETAKQHGLKVIVSQVEQASAMAVLWQLGVNYIQGNSVQEPEVVMLQADISLG